MRSFPTVQVGVFTRVPLACHPTIAAVHALVEEGRMPLSGEVDVELKVGVLPLEIREGHFCLGGYSEGADVHARHFAPG